MHTTAIDPREGLYLGLISGTSADGIDGALVRFVPRLEVLAAQTIPYASELRAKIIALARTQAQLCLDEIGELDHAIGAQFATAANALLRRAGVEATAVSAIGSHGQTICHRPGGKSPFTLQLGDPTLIAERSGILTVADFRRADVAAGGQGAPLLPALHAALFAIPGATRAVLNLGGIANLTLLRPGSDVIGFDSGPANCLLDAWAARHLRSERDEGGAWAASGQANDALLQACLADPYFSATAPKSTGRETFNLDWLDARIPNGVAPVDVQASLLALSAQSIAAALHGTGTSEVYACGGGVHNAALMAALRSALPQLRVETTAALGLDPDFVEAVGFAWLARARLLGEPGNLPSVTGARGPRLLGALYAAPSLPMSQ